ncbi:hypothetical protein AFI02nite_41170 [Aliivibrio fischeri]|uniref:Uncharacterized protein n=1 Tax=Aliivibrio fischeri TaxID=668 RepID=A0A510URJ6_ALIFS|nr:hypothetical protein AFI02nite_41170 [Aliivibrio fischeri]
MALVIKCEKGQLNITSVPDPKSYSYPTTNSDFEKNIVEFKGVGPKL